MQILTLIQTMENENEKYPAVLISHLAVATYTNHSNQILP